MEFRQIRYALSVARERSFTGAARRLNISQSAVSEQVNLLEHEIGFQLFRRTPRGIELTEPGRTFLYEAERLVGDLMSLTDIWAAAGHPNTVFRLSPSDLARITAGRATAVK